MSDPLDELLARLRDDITLRTSVEEATRQAAVLPILRRLGWDVEDLQEVAPEFPVEQGRVDYCLNLGERSAVFIEVKRTGESLESHQEQLLGYAFREGVKQAVLTDGLVWWLYLPVHEGSWEQRRFFTIDLERQGSDDAAEHFRQFLARDAVLDGSALAEAEAVLLSEERARGVRQAMPKAWEQLLLGPDELLTEILVDAVEGLSGFRPDDEEVARFLAAAASGLPAVTPTRSPTAKQPASPPAKPPGTPTVGSYTFTSPTSYSLFGQRQGITTFQAVLMGVYGAMYDEHRQDFDQVLTLKGRKRPYFSKDSDTLREPKLIADSGIHAETNLSANDIVRRCRDVLDLFGHDPDDLTIEAS